MICCRVCNVARDCYNLQHRGPVNTVYWGIYILPKHLTNFHMNYLQYVLVPYKNLVLLSLLMILSNFIYSLEDESENIIFFINTQIFNRHNRTSGIILRLYCLHFVTVRFCNEFKCYTSDGYHNLNYKINALYSRNMTKTFKWLTETPLK